MIAATRINTSKICKLYVSIDHLLRLALRSILANAKIWIFQFRRSPQAFYLVYLASLFFDMANLSTKRR